MALIDLLQDGQTEIEFVAEISHRDPDTDTESITYISRHGTVPATGPSDTPANQTFPPHLQSLGVIRENLDEDLLFSGLSVYELGSLTIKNEPATAPPAPGLYDSWLDLSFAGFDVVIKAGAQGAAYSTFETIAIGTSNGNPVFQIDNNEITLSLQSAFSKLDVPLIVNRYVGIPSCLKTITDSTRAQAPSNVAYDVNSFTVMVSFRTSGVGSVGGSGALIRRSISGANRQFTIVIYWVGSVNAGKVSVVAPSSGGVPMFSEILSDISYADGEWHTAVFSLRDASNCYLEIDSVPIGERTFTTTVDKPATSIDIGLSCPGVEFNDCRMYSAYLTPEESRVARAVIPEGGETALIGAWRFDDSIGSAIVTDYSPTGNNATINNVENVDYIWNPSDLGLPEQAGLPMPIVYGDVFNAPLDLIDSAIERHRWHDGLSAAPNTYNTDLTVKVRGVPIAEGTDWDHQPDVSTGVIETTDEIDQPATFDTEVDTPGSYPNAIIEFLLVDRGGYNNAADIELNQLDAMSYLLPSPSGVFVGGSDKSLGAVVGEYLVGIGGHLRLDIPTGRFLPSHLLSPVGPSPVNDEDAVLEFIGSPDDAINFSGIGSSTSSTSLACWFKSHRGLQDAAAGIYSESPLLDKYQTSPDRGYFLYIGSSGELECFIAGVGVISTPSFVVKPGVWYFVVASFDNTANTFKIFLGAEGNSMTEVSSTIAFGTPVISTGPLIIGNKQSGNSPLLGSIAHVQVWSKAHTLAQAQTLMDQFEAGTHLVGNEANLLFYSPINDGVGSTTVADLVFSAIGTISGLCRWAPQLTLDFTTSQPNGAIEKLSRMIPAGDIEIRYRPNHFPMQQSDIAAPVLDPESLALRLPYLSLKPDRADIKADFPQTRSILISSPFLHQSAAAYLYTLISGRFGPDNLLVRISGIHRDALLLSLTDEIRIIAAHDGLSAGVNFRVVEKSNSWGDLSTSLLLALGKLD